jgi:hypothetical protein
MNYSVTDVRGLIYSKSETPNLDFKEIAIWDRVHNGDRLEITKDILAMANTRDGGKIVLGVNDKTRDVVGLSEEAYASLEITKINEFVHRYSDPVFTCEVIKLPDFEGKRIVIIDVPEFKEDPIICKDNGHDSKNNLVLMKGGIYVRTAKCSSELVSSADETRSILERGLNKKSDEILAKIARLVQSVQSRPLTIEADSQLTHRIQEAPQKLSSPEFKAEIKDALDFFDQTIKRDHGYWQVIGHPVMYNPVFLENPIQAHEIVEKSTVHLRGWDFPHDDSHGNSKNTAKGRQSFTIWEGYHYEAWRMYKSGLFIWREYYMEDVEGYSKLDKKVLSFVNVIYSMTEFLLFLKRAYTEFLKVDAIHFELELTDCKARKLVSLDSGVHIWDDYVSVEEVIPIERDLNSVELEASATTIARDIAKEIFMIFNWNDPADSMIEDWQNKLIQRRF